jgi:hypothetical protein
VVQRDNLDPKGLIRESYRIDAITIEECRSIFLDWAISLPEGVKPQDAIRELLAIYGGWSNHPMTVVLREGENGPAQATRRGGRAARLSGEG